MAVTAKQLANLKPSKKGDPPRNPMGINGHTQRLAFTREIEECITPQRRERLRERLFELAEAVGEAWAMKIVTDRFWPATAHVELEHAPGPALDTEEAWFELAKLIGDMDISHERVPAALHALRRALEKAIGRPPRPPEFAEETAKILLEVLGYEVRPPEPIDMPSSDPKLFARTREA
jgi:hypothetical protein